MKPIEIFIKTNGTVESATIECDRRKMSLIFMMQNGFKKAYTASDLFICFGMLRAELPEITFFCKGAKLNVHPSRMTSQMSSGLVAYELELGTPSEDENIVRIFDYEDKNLTCNIKEQQTFYKKWIESLAVPTPDQPEENAD
jgi:hypothetical protein